jgi:retron-type reverse transcriptase
MKKPSQSGCSVRAAVAGDTGGELAEVTVTAERRTENLQDVPIAIQAPTGETLQKPEVRLLSIPAIRDRVVQGALKLIWSRSLRRISNRDRMDIV